MSLILHLWICNTLVKTLCFVYPKSKRVRCYLQKYIYFNRSKEVLRKVRNKSITSISLDLIFHKSIKRLPNFYVFGKLWFRWCKQCIIYVNQSMQLYIFFRISKYSVKSSDPLSRSNSEKGNNLNKHDISSADTCYRLSNKPLGLMVSRKTLYNLCLFATRNPCARANFNPMCIIWKYNLYRTLSEDISRKISEISQILTLI